MTDRKRKKTVTNAHKLLLRIYRVMGPKEAGPRGIQPVPPKKFASMKRAEIDRWDGMGDRLLFQTIAKEIVRAASDRTD